VDETIGTRLVEAIVARDESAIAACFAPHVEFRALTPAGLRERSGAAETAALLHAWFADSTELDVAEAQSEPIGDRLHVTYRLEGVEGGEPYVIEQQLYCDVGDAGIERANLLCSGSEPRRF